LKPTILTFGNYKPRIAADVFIAHTAAVIGDVEIGEGSGVWFGCTLRGDGNLIKIGKRTNIQDGTVIHVNGQPDGSRGALGYAAIIGDEVTVGHLAIIHGCLLENRAFVGMKAMVMDGCVIESNGMLAAGAVLTPGKRIKTGELWAGTPAKLMRELKPAEWDMIGATVDHYVGRAEFYRKNVELVGR